MMGGPRPGARCTTGVCCDAVALICLERNCDAFSLLGTFVDRELCFVIGDHLIAGENYGRFPDRLPNNCSTCDRQIIVTGDAHSAMNEKQSEEVTARIPEHYTDKAFPDNAQVVMLYAAMCAEIRSYYLLLWGYKWVEDVSCRGRRKPGCAPRLSGAHPGRIGR